MKTVENKVCGRSQMQAPGLGEHESEPRSVWEAVDEALGKHCPFSQFCEKHPLFPLRFSCLDPDDASVWFEVTNMKENIFSWLLKVYRLVRPKASSEDAAQFAVCNYFASLRFHLRDFPRLIEVFGSKFNHGWRSYLEELGTDEPDVLQICPHDGVCANAAGRLNCHVWDDGQKLKLRHDIPAACQYNRRTGEFYDKEQVFNAKNKESPPVSCCDGVRCSQSTRGGSKLELEGVSRRLRSNMKLAFIG